MSRGAGRRVRLGIIGLGTVAQAVHLPLLSRHRDRFEVTAVCDLSAELAAVVTGRFGLGDAERCRTAGSYSFMYPSCSGAPVRSDSRASSSASARV